MKEIRYEPELANQGGFGCYLDGDLVAVAWNYADADRALDALLAEIAAEQMREREEPAPPAA